MKIDAAGALVQVVDILRAEKKAAGELRFKFGERDVRGVGLGFCAVGAARGIELPDQRGIAPQCVGCADFFNAVAGPQAVFGAESGQAAFGADAGAGEDEDAVGGSDGDGHDRVASALLSVPLTLAISYASADRADLKLSTAPAESCRWSCALPGRSGPGRLRPADRCARCAV